MNKPNYRNDYDEMIDKERLDVEAFLKRKKEHLEKEVEVRLSLGDKGFKKIEPVFEYENTPEYIAHAKNALRLAVDEQILDINMKINQIERQRLDAKELRRAQDELAAKEASK